MENLESWHLEQERGVRGSPDVGISSFAVQNFALPGRGAHEPKSMDRAPRLGDSRQQCTPLNP